MELPKYICVHELFVCMWFWNGKKIGTQIGEFLGWVRMQRTSLWKRTFWFENRDSDWGVSRVIHWVIFCGTVEVLFCWVRYYWLIGVIIFHLNWRPRSRTDPGKPNYEQMNRPLGGGGVFVEWGQCGRMIDCFDLSRSLGLSS